MAGAIKEYEPTPNPNALKCVLRTPLTSARALRSVRTVRGYTAPGPSQEEDELAAALFAVAGVASVLIHPTWVTIGKQAETPWSSIKSHVSGVLRAIEET